MRVRVRVRARPELTCFASTERMMLVLAVPGPPTSSTGRPLATLSSMLYSLRTESIVGMRSVANSAFRSWPEYDQPGMRLPQCTHSYLYAGWRADPQPWGGHRRAGGWLQRGWGLCPGGGEAPWPMAVAGVVRVRCAAAGEGRRNLDPLEGVQAVPLTLALTLTLTLTLALTYRLFSAWIMNSKTESGAVA